MQMRGTRSGGWVTEHKEPVAESTDNAEPAPDAPTHVALEQQSYVPPTVVTTTQQYPPNSRACGDRLAQVWHVYESSVSNFVGQCARAFGHLGLVCAQRPILVLVITLGVALASMTGWARYQLETESEVLWVPQEGKAHHDKMYVQENFPRRVTGGSFYAQLSPSRYAQYGGSDNALLIPVTWEMFRLHNKVMAITVANDEGLPVTFANLCKKNTAGTCDLAHSYLWFWGNSFSTFLDSIQGSATDPLAGSATTFKSQVSQLTYPTGEGVPLLSVFGDIYTRFFLVASVKVIAQDYNMDQQVSKATVKRWHLAFIDLMSSELPNQQYMTYTYISGSSVGEELGKAINNDLILIVISLFIFIITAVVVMSSYSVSTRTTLALLGVVVIGMALASGWGWGLIFGMPFTPLQQLSVFILLGMGIDVMFIIVKSYEIIIQREPWLSLPDAMYKVMSTAGLSVSVVLLSSAVAYALGTMDVLPSVKWFSAYATLNTLMILVLMLSAFVAMLALTEKRIAARRYDFCCCFGPGSRTAMESATAPDQATYPGQATAPDQATYPGQATAPDQAPSFSSGTRRPAVIKDDDIQGENKAKRFFRKYYAPALSRGYVKVLVLLFFGLLIAGSAYGTTKLQYGLPLKDLAPDSSYLQDYDTVQQATYRQQLGELAALYIRDVDVSNPAVQYKMLRAWDLSLQNSFVNASITAFISNWLIDFIKWSQDQGQTVTLPVNNCYNPLIGKIQGELTKVMIPVTITGCVPKTKFYTLLAQWLVVKPNFNVVRRGDGTILVSKMPLIQTPSASSERYNVEMLKSIRPLEDDINDQLFSQESSDAEWHCAIIYGSSYIFAEGDFLLEDQTFWFCILAVIGIGFVCLLMLVNPLASLFMIIAVGLVQLFLFGELWALKIKFNQVSMINLIMATGLATDYTVYFAQKFMTCTGTGNERMATALTDTGSAVFLGGITALLGSIPMAFSKSIIIRTFFKLIFGTIVLSLSVGLVLMPVVFALLPLPPIKSALVDDDDALNRRMSNTTSIATSTASAISRPDSPTTKEQKHTVPIAV